MTIDIATEIKNWQSPESIKQTFIKMKFNDVNIDSQQKYILVKMDEKQETFLKIMEVNNLSTPSKFTSKIQYLLLHEKYSKFRFVKQDYTASTNQTLLKFNFTKQTMDKNTKAILRESIKPNNIPMFERLFHSNEVNIFITNLEKILNSVVKKLSESELENLANSMKLNIITNDKNKTKKSERLNASAKRVLLIIASAAMFHARLDKHLSHMRPDIDAVTGKEFTKAWPPPTLVQCSKGQNTVEMLLDSWRSIMAINYRPIFESGRLILTSNNSSNFNVEIKKIVDWSINTMKYISGLKHDILGRLFHKMLETAKYDGSFYTSVSSASLLAQLAIQKDKIPKNVKNMRIIDPACGTGTLLMASAQQLIEMTDSKKSSLLVKSLVEDILYGIDINSSAAHMAATTLGLLSPTVQFHQMNIGIADFGRYGNKYKAGSLELFEDPGLFAYQNRKNGSTYQIDSKIIMSDLKHHFADLVIMNPPYTRKDLRHKQLDPTTISNVKNREKDIFKLLNCTSFDSSGPQFLIMSYRLVKMNGRVATVFPLSFLRSPSVSKLRKYLAEKFHFEIIVISHDPNRFFFSESTNISEALIIMTPKNSLNKNKSTLIINLLVNPTHQNEIDNLCVKLYSGETKGSGWYSVNRPVAYINAGDYKGTQFASKFLSEIFDKLKNNNIIKISELGSVADVGYQGRTVSMYFDHKQYDSNLNIKNEHPTVWFHKTKFKDKIPSVETICPEFDGYIVPKKSKTVKNMVKNYLKKKGMLLLPERFDTTITRCFSIKTEIPVLGGSAWTPISLKKDENYLENSNKFEDSFGKFYDNKSSSSIVDNIESKWAKALAVWFNSSLGIICIIGHCIVKKQPYPRLSEHAELLIPIMNNDQMTLLSELFDQIKDQKLKSIAKLKHDTTRLKIDKKISEVFDIKVQLMSLIQNKLYVEPMFTKNSLKIYDNNDSMSSPTE